MAYAFEQLRHDGLALRHEYDPHRLSKAAVIDHERGYVVGIDRHHHVQEIIHPQFNGSTEAVISMNYQEQPLHFPDEHDTLAGREVDSYHPYTTLDSTFRLADAALFMAIRDVPLNTYQRYQWFLRGRSYIDQAHWAYMDSAKTQRGPLKKEMFERPHDFLHLPDPSLVELFKAFKARGIIVGILSNSDAEYVRFLLEPLGIAPYVDFVVGTARKPSYFERGRHHELEDRFGVTPGEVLYMGDDAYQDCVAPHKYAHWQTVALLEKHPGREGLHRNPVLFGGNSNGNNHGTGKSYETHLARQIEQHASVIVEGHLAQLLQLDLRKQYDVQHGLSN